MDAFPTGGSSNGGHTSAGRRPTTGGRPRVPGGDHLCSHVRVHLAAAAAGVRPGLAWPTVYRGFARWSQDRVWARLHRILLDELGALGELDWSRCAIDSVSLRATKGGH